jgi:hypothetical protein
MAGMPDPPAAPAAYLLTPPADPPASTLAPPAVPAASTLATLADPAASTAALLATLADPAASTADLLAALAALRRIRGDLDLTERGLIERAREGGVSWPGIAEALGLASRQAAEQRLLRLSGPAGRDPRAARRQRSVDATQGDAVARLRAAVRAASRQILADPGWEGRSGRAALARASLSEAALAPPGAMFALVEAAMTDLSGLRLADLPAPLRSAVEALGRALDAARPQSQG